MASFRGSRFFLSNFSRFETRLPSGRVFPTAEHAFVALKCPSLSDQLQSPCSFGPAEAKRLGRSAPLTPGWEKPEVRIALMRVVLAGKFRPGTRAAELLLSTGEEELIELNEWHDTFWGVCNGVGQNWLGRLLEERRATLQLAIPNHPLEALP